MCQLPNIEPFRHRYTDLEKELADPNIFKDSDRAKLISREHNQTGEIIKLYQLAQNCLLELKQANDMLQDPEMAEAAREEIQSSKYERERAVMRLHFLLLIYFVCTPNMVNLRIGLLSFLARAHLKQADLRK